MSGDGEAHMKLPDHTLPSDYSDVQPKSYDPDYISQISSQMQVPHRIAMDGTQNEGPGNMNRYATQYSDMMVPDRIVLAGDNKHLGLKSDLDLKPAVSVDPNNMAYVGLMTPPRTLTSDESFPFVDQPEEDKMNKVGGVSQSAPANGYITGQTSAFSPGVNLDDSILLNEEDEATLLRTQVAKLTRRVHVIEQEHQRRSQRERVVYPVVLGYFLWKVLAWLMRDR